MKNLIGSEVLRIELLIFAEVLISLGSLAKIEDRVFSFVGFLVLIREYISVSVFGSKVWQGNCELEAI